MELRTETLSKEYKKTLALNCVNLFFEPGVYGLLGPNGSGKSTLMNILTGNIVPTAGRVTWDEKDIRKQGKQYRGIVGYVPQQQALYQEFTVWLFLNYMATLKGIHKKEMKSKIFCVIEKVGLVEQMGYKINMLSGGMKQRLLIAQAILGDPRILIMDEPTVGLDPNQRLQIRELINNISKDKIVLIATHIVSDLELLSDEIVMLKKGNVIAQGKVEQLIQDIKEKEGLTSIVTLEDVYLHYFGESL